MPGEKFWKGRFLLWIADDEAATPVRIVGEKGMLTVRLDLVDATHDGALPAAEPLDGETVSVHP